MIFERRFQVGWADVDMNGHMRNTAYLDRCVDARVWFFSANGFPAREFFRQQLGPVIRRDDIEYHREYRLLDELRVTTYGGWLDLRARQRMIPPPAIVDAMALLSRTEDFQTLDNSVRSN